MREKLREFGFSEKEISVYLALLELGDAVASTIAKRAKVNRSTTYVILDVLLDKKLVQAVEKRGIKVYRVTSPEKLVDYFENTAKQYGGFASSAKKLVPELKSLYKPKTEEISQPKVQVFEGTEGLKTVYEDTLSSLETIRAYASVESAPNKAKKDIKVEVIFPDTAAAKTQIAHHKEVAEEAFRVPTGNYGFSSEINIYDKKVIFIAPAEKFGLIIESKEFAETLKKAFISARKEARGLGKGAILKSEKTAEGLA